ncbi:hypothetical protein BJ912DRAFT_1070230 [Pholiota molesta]|nr:hypothetical protein BJ912DRAFT_1070230 [Pholiota molesta]
MLPEEFLVAANADFDLADCLKAKVDLVNSAVCSGSSDLFSLSPLTSPEPTPPPSPQIAPTPLTAQKTALPPSTKARDRGAAKKAASRAHRKKKREEVPFGHYQVRDKVVEKALASLEKMTAPGTKKTYRLDQLVGEGSKFKFHLKKWTAVCIADKSKRTVAVLAGCPPVENWAQLHQQAASALEEKRSQCSVPRDKRKHRRGYFTALQCGVSHGGGQKQPCNLTNGAQNEKILEELNELEPFKRMAAFASACMANWAPKLYTYYVDHMRPLYEADTALKPVFRSCIFSAATYNFGPQTVCYKHRDFANLTFGWCAVWALGTFDPTEGGHLILWDCHLVVEFPPGSLILLASALISHSNTSIASTSAGTPSRSTPLVLYSVGVKLLYESGGLLLPAFAGAVGGRRAEESAKMDGRARITSKVVTAKFFFVLKTGKALFFP